MIEQQAVVIAVRESQALVAIQRQSSCGGCGQSGACSSSTISAWFRSREQQIVIENPLNATVGDRVVLGIDESAIPTASLIAYMLPIAGLLGGAAGGAVLGTEPLSITLGLLGLIGGFAASRTAVDKVIDRNRYRVRMLANQSCPGDRLVARFPNP